MEQVFQVTGLCVVGALLALVLKKGSPELALLLALAAVAAVLLFLAGALGELLDFGRSLHPFVQDGGHCPGGKDRRQSLP